MSTRTHTKSDPAIILVNVALIFAAIAVTLTVLGLTEVVRSAHYLSPGLGIVASLLLVARNRIVRKSQPDIHADGYSS